MVAAGVEARDHPCVALRPRRGVGAAEEGDGVLDAAVPAADGAVFGPREEAGGVGGVRGDARHDLEVVRVDCEGRGAGEAGAHGLSDVVDADTLAARCPYGRRDLFSGGEKAASLLCNRLHARDDFHFRAADLASQLPPPLGVGVCAGAECDAGGRACLARHPAEQQRSVLLRQVRGARVVPLQRQPLQLLVVVVCCLSWRVHEA
mmetsp:Transcript_35545/g.83608  ORF Transcript_35545/g.83608 Transcript_35545/m.83608 type:complete len:205 (+) Transcript_35545:725-1339(+)